jgi:hypothetical protein
MPDPKIGLVDGTAAEPPQKSHTRRAIRPYWNCDTMSHQASGASIKDWVLPMTLKTPPPFSTLMMAH